MTTPIATLPMLARTEGHCAGGFTLVELIATIGIVAILMLVAYPQVATMLVAQRIRSGGTDLVSSLLIARSEAIKRGGQVSLAPLADKNWSTGWVATTAATKEQVDRRDAPGVRVEITKAPETLTYERNGRIAGTITNRFQFSDVDKDPAAPSRCVIVDPSGLPRIAAGACT